VQRIDLLRGGAAVAGAVAALLVGPAGAGGQVVYSPDVDAEIGGVHVVDEDAVSDDLAGTVVRLPIPGLPREVDVDGYHVDDGGDVLFSLDTSAELGGVPVRPADVVRYAGGFSLEFDAAASGVPDGANVDAVSRTPVGDLVLSFDRHVDLGAILADDEDLVTFDGATFGLLLDGSAEGVADGLDLDGAHVKSGGIELLVSFDAPGLVGGMPIDDDDVLEFDTSIGTWSVVYDGAAHHPSLEAGGVDAVALPEPGGWLALSCGGLLLAALRRRRAPPSRRLQSRGLSPAAAPCPRSRRRAGPRR
jgi:hypothetical protein